MAREGTGRGVRVAVGLPPAARARNLCPRAQEMLAAFADEVIWCEQEHPWSAEQKREVLRDADAYLTGWGDSGLTPETILSAGSLRVVALIGSSVAHIAPDALFARGIRVCHTADAIAVTVAEFAAGAILALSHNQFHYAAAMGAGQWSAEAPWPAFNLERRTLSLIGCGKVGRHLIRLLSGFRPRVLVCDPHLSDHEIACLGAERADLETALREAWVVSLHAGLTPETRGMIGREQLAWLRDGAVLVNTARGGVFDEAALAQRLREGTVRALLDVFEEEPLAGDSPLRGLPNVYLTPHVAGLSLDTLERIGLDAVGDLIAFFEGRPLSHPVTPEMVQRMT
jgi:phosphoglycerate dehydrogenase-like enzyme